MAEETIGLFFGKDQIISEGGEDLFSPPIIPTLLSLFIRSSLMGTNDLVTYRPQASASGKVSTDAIHPALKSELHNYNITISPSIIIQEILMSASTGCLTSLRNGE